MSFNNKIKTKIEEIALFFRKSILDRVLRFFAQISLIVYGLIKSLIPMGLRPKLLLILEKSGIKVKPLKYKLLRIAKTNESIIFFFLSNLFSIVSDFFKSIIHRNSSQLKVSDNSQLFGKKLNDQNNPYDLKKKILRDKFKNELEMFLDSEQRIFLTEEVSEPLVSIIIVTFNSAELSLECFKALSVLNDISFECIVCDNASSDATEKLLSKIVGVKVIRNELNEGFIKAVNKAAKFAKGKYILLLNNDIFVEPSSISALVKRIESSNEIGIVGGRIILLDNTLQEAGCIIWNDGSTLGYGRGCNPKKSEFLFARDVDYCSGTLLLIRSSLFNRLNGFDECFAPAYYEDTDLCMRCWLNGYRVVYEPLSIAHHFEYGSSGEDNAINLMQLNNAYFYDKHKKTLTSHLHCEKDNIILAKDHFRNKKRVLIIDDRVPFEWLGAGYPRMSRIIKDLVKANVQLTFFSTNKIEENIDEIHDSFPDECEFIWDQGVDKLPIFLKARKKYFDVIIISRVHNKEFFDAVYPTIRNDLVNCKIIYDVEAVSSIRIALHCALKGDALPQAEIDSMLMNEISLATNVEKVIVVNKYEGDIFRRFSEKPIFELGHCMEVKPTKKSFEERNDFLFVGRLEEDDSPNVDSILWFTKEIFPIIKAKLNKDVRLYIVGICGAKSLKSIDDDLVYFLGKLKSLDEVYDSCRVFVAPTRFAAGIPHKVHEAASYGLPTVATKLIAYQLGWEVGTSILAADDCNGFANECVKLYNDESLWKKIRENSILSVKKCCDCEVFSRKIKQIINV